jgi:hypothetical protein
VFQRDSGGRIRYWIEPDLFSVGQVIVNKYQNIEKQKLLERNRFGLDRDNDRDFHHGIGHG